jgi:putative transposase
MSTSDPSDLTDAEWECVQRYRPPHSRRGRPRTHPLGRILHAIFYVLRTNCPGSYLPSKFPPLRAIFYRFWRFRRKNTLRSLYSALHRAARERGGRHPDPSAAAMDSQSVKAVEESGSIRGL